jgi:hypothetical protein
MTIKRRRPGEPLPQSAQSANGECPSDASRYDAKQAVEAQLIAARRIAEKRRKVLRKLAG